MAKRRTGPSSLDTARARLRETKGTAQSTSERVELTQDLAALILEGAKELQTKQEARKDLLLARMLKDPKGKALLSQILDSCNRSEDPKKLIDHLLYLLDTYGIPSFLSPLHRFGFQALKIFGKWLPRFCSRCIRSFVHSQVKEVIAPGEDSSLFPLLKKWKKDGIKINLNRLGEAILGENEAEARVEQYIQDLANPNIRVISIKISSICSQLNVLAFHESLKRLKDVLRKVYREALKGNKFVNLDMEEYKDLHLTAQLFQEVLSEPEFLPLTAGIALQSYIPDSHAVQEMLTVWAIKRCELGGAPIKVRIVKGANLGMERVEASLKEWPQAPYQQKTEVDASFIRMLEWALKKERAVAVHLGIGSHNLFDLVYAMLLAIEQDVEECVEIEMLAGMAPHLARAMHAIWDQVLLYMPCAKLEDFHNAIAYLMRRLDENTAPSNFLAHLFDLTTTSDAWREQCDLFASSCDDSESVSLIPRRLQNRKLLQQNSRLHVHFANEPDSDFSLAQNRAWAREIVKEWQVNYHEISLCVGGHNMVSSEIAQGIDPSRPDCPIHTHFLAQEYQIEMALGCVQNQAKIWAEVPLQRRVAIVRQVAAILRTSRKHLIGAMMQEVAKIIPEADSEVSEAIDFVEYYTKETQGWAHGNKLFSQGKSALVLSPWNFPISIPTSALVTSLISGYSVIFKPAPEAILCGWLLACAFWQAGVPKEVLQFVTCRDDPIGTRLVQDPRIDIVILTGGTATAKFFIQKRPNIKLFAETGGKNTLIVTASADRDLAVKDAATSAFGYAGQKCSALSLLILEEEVYKSKRFLNQLLDAAAHLVCGQSYNLSTIVNPLIRPASPHLYRALTTLEEGESWLLAPKQDPKNPNLWSPGIKLGVRPQSFMHQTELFGPVLGVMCAKNVESALQLANGTPYGLTAGLHSLDLRDHELWKAKIEAGNCYINRAITGAITQRQPFGGCKASSFGVGMKVGGPNYLLQLGKTEGIPPLGQHEVKPEVMDLEGALQKLGATQSDRDRLYKAAASMTFWWDNYFTKPRTLRRLVGQDNILEYKSRSELFVLFQDDDTLLDLFLVLTGANIAHCTLVCGASFKQYRRLFRQGPLAHLFDKFGWRYCSLEGIASLIVRSGGAHVRALSTPPHDFLEQIAPSLASLDVSLPSHNGRLELIHFVREVSISYDYHRYGSLMARSDEYREPVL